MQDVEYKKVEEAIEQINVENDEREIDYVVADDEEDKASANTSVGIQPVKPIKQEKSDLNIGSTQVRLLMEAMEEMSRKIDIMASNVSALSVQSDEVEQVVQSPAELLHADSKDFYKENLTSVYMKAAEGVQNGDPLDVVNGDYLTLINAVLSLKDCDVYSEHPLDTVIKALWEAK